MISKIEALNYRCLRDIEQPLARFQVLVGPNASGKTTFLDVIGFLGRLVSEGLETAVRERTSNPQDLTWRRDGDAFELAVEARIPAELRASLSRPELDTVRYQIRVRTVRQLGIPAESLVLVTHAEERGDEVGDFPEEPKPRISLVGARGPGPMTVVEKARGKDIYEAESGDGLRVNFNLGDRKSALANLPEDETKFPVATWFKRLLAEGVQPFVLNSLAIRRASAPAQGSGFKPDGSNLPWVIAGLEESVEGRERLGDWIRHLSTALPDLKSIRTIERPDDRHRYLVLSYENGVEVPSWMASDGTLRMLALTLPAYLPDLTGVYLIEEPENGIHPRAMEAVFQSLSSVYGAQMLIASHSPVVLGLVDPKDVLCFAKSPSGATAVVRGSEHPAQRSWKGETNLGVLFAGGVLS